MINFLLVKIIIVAGYLFQVQLSGLWEKPVVESQSQLYVFMNPCNFGFHLLLYRLIHHEIKKEYKFLFDRYDMPAFLSVFSLSQMQCVLSLTAIEWVMMSSAELFIAQLFFLAGFFISKRLDGISTIHSVRRSQKRKLWSVVIVFEVRMVWK